MLKGPEPRCASAGLLVLLKSYLYCMNYLAHLSLSGRDEEILAGNYMGDSLRGIDVRTFPQKIQRGIQLHRFIDSFTDHHPVFLSAKKIFAPQFDKYSGAIADVCFDHFLGKNYGALHSADLQHFAYSCYRDLGKYYFLFPDKAKQFYQYMVQNNILFNYSKKEGVERVLKGMTHRIGEKALLYNAYPIFLERYDELESAFLEFYPAVTAGCEAFMQQ